MERRRGGIGGAEPQERLRPVDNGAVRPTELEGVEAGGGEWDEGEGIVRQAKYETLMLEQKKQKHRRNDNDDEFSPQHDVRRTTLRGTPSNV